MFNHNAHANDIKIGGLLMNNTITWFGQDFFQYFAREWRNQGFRGNQKIFVEEIPSARRGTQIVIRYKGEVVYRTSVNGTRSASRTNGVYAVPAVLSRVRYLDRQASNNTLIADLSGDGF